MRQIDVLTSSESEYTPENGWIALSITEGRVVRDLLCNGLLNLLHDRGFGVVVITPAARVPEFVQTWSQPGVKFRVLKHYQLGAKEARALAIRNRILRMNHWSFKLWLFFEPQFFPPDPEYVKMLKEAACRLAVITHPMFHAEMPVFRAAQALGIPTLGVMRSWDNLFKGLRIRPDILCVWNEVNRDEACGLIKYPRDRVSVIGGTQFDPYFAPDTLWSRQRFAKSLGLDAQRPIITLATTGSFRHLYDETFLINALINAIAKEEIPGRPQLICRLHPASRLEYLQKFKNYPDLRLSYIRGYIPTLGWTMEREEVIQVANLLKHSDVVVSPGSTITLESAIFDTPVIVPVFHPYQPELAHMQFQEWTLANHYKHLLELDLIPIIWHPEDLVPEINRCLDNPTLYKRQRAQLVQDYIHYTDGRSTQRLADLIVDMST